MKLNKQCMKDILLYVSENTKIKVDDTNYHNIDTSSMNISTLLEKMSKESEYKIEEIAYNLLQCHRYGFIDIDMQYQNNHIIQSALSDIFGITLAGIDFMNEDRH